MERAKRRPRDGVSRVKRMLGFPIPLIIGVATGSSLVLSPFFPCLVSGSLTPLAFYDFQVADKFANGSTDLEYTVHALPQASDCQYGVAYLVNGITAQGRWYQVGLSWDWSSYQSQKGFEMNYEVFDRPFHSIYPANGGSGLASFDGPVDAGDLVTLSLRIVNDSVNFLAHDLATGASSQTTFPSSGSEAFVGGVNSTASDVFFTGLMTECYRDSPGNVQLTNHTYTDLRSPVSTQETSIDEWNFSDCKYPVGTTQLQPLGSGFADYRDSSLSEYEGDSVVTWTNTTSFAVSVGS
ncbi:MAG: hypothetical protein ACLPWO_05390 [Thermoplasmata archaeon]